MRAGGTTSGISAITTLPSLPASDAILIAQIVSLNRLRSSPVYCPIPSFNLVTKAPCSSKRKTREKASERATISQPRHSALGRLQHICIPALRPRHLTVSVRPGSRRVPTQPMLRLHDANRRGQWGWPSPKVSEEPEGIGSRLQWAAVRPDSAKMDQGRTVQGGLFSQVSIQPHPPRPLQCLTVIVHIVEVGTPSSRESSTAPPPHLRLPEPFKSQVAENGDGKKRAAGGCAMLAPKG